MPNPPKLTAARAKAELRKETSAERRRVVQRYFRTGPGEYGEGDKFLGVTVPYLRKVARIYRMMPLPEVGRLLASPFHEDRLLAFVVLAERAKRAPADEARLIADFYLTNRRHVNNWDLVDSSAEYILGPFLDELTPTLDTLSRSDNVWDRRISILAHMKEIRQGKTKRYLRFAARFIDDEHDLIHKAVGWLLRETGKTDPAGLRRFLDRYATRMPRTMLRYAIERLPEPERRAFMTRPRA